MPQQTSDAIESLKSGILHLSAYAAWPQFAALNIDAGELPWTQTVAAMQSEAQLVRLLDAITQQIDNQAAAGFGGGSMARPGETSAGQQSSV